MKEKTEKMWKISETKTWFLEKVNKFNKPPYGLTRTKRHKLSVSRMRDDITTDSTDVERIIRKYCEQLLCQYIWQFRGNGQIPLRTQTTKDHSVRNR